MQQTHHRLSAAPDARSLQDPAKDPRLKSEWQKVGSNSGPTAPEARTLPLLHAPFLYSCYSFATLVSEPLTLKPLLNVLYYQNLSRKKCLSMNVVDEHFLGLNIEYVEYVCKVV